MMTEAANDLGKWRESEVDRSRLVNAQIGAIAEALLEFGGAAHRERVLEAVAARLGRSGVTETLRRELIAAFLAHCDHAAAMGRRALFHRPPGEEFRRWALTAESLFFLQHGGRAQLV